MKENKGTLYLVPTPLGNLEDITFRAVNILKNVDYVACEDTRNTSKLLNLLNIENKTYSCHEHNEKVASQKIINDLLNGKNVAYASDAGSPCISDPGSILVTEAIKNNIPVIPLPGANAGLTALVASGLDTTNFYFVGFLDAKISKKEAGLAGFLKIPATLIFYEAPHRISETLNSMYKIFGNRKVVIARELTKIHEEFIRSNLEELVKNPIELKGEMVVLVEGYKEEKTENTNEKEILSTAKSLLDNGYSTKDTIDIISIIFKINKNYLKDLLMKKN